MSAQIIKLKIDKSVKNVHSCLVRNAIQSIKSNLTDSSMEHLIPFLSAAAMSPEFLCRVTNENLWAIQEAVNEEINYRNEEMEA